MFVLVFFMLFWKVVNRYGWMRWRGVKMMMMMMMLEQVGDDRVGKYLVGGDGKGRRGRRRR